MKLTSFPLLLAAALLAALVGPNGASEAAQPGATSHALEIGVTQRLIVKYRAGHATALSADAPTREKAMSALGRIPMTTLRDSGNGSVVYKLSSPVTQAAARAIAMRLALDPAVEYAEPDVRLHSMADPAPNDTYAAQQWNLLSASAATTGLFPQPSNLGGANFYNAVPLAGSSRVVVAVLDTGSLPHPDLVANLLPGYDFVSADTVGGNTFTSANDGNGRDADATDPGDACASAHTSSSWHGLNVMSVIAASTGNGMGIAGAAGNIVQVVPVRVLGACGGWLSDIVDGLRWAAGDTVSGVPMNSSPARVINLSLGGNTGESCPQSMQDAVNVAITKGTVVVVAAGNDGSSAGISAIASCNGVIAVAAHTRSGDIAGYSNITAGVTLSAPAGGTCRFQSATCQANDYPLALSNMGTNAAGAYSQGVAFSGTSAATPHVSAAAALMVAANPLLTPAQIKSALTASARAYPTDGYCSQNRQCGAGMLDAAKAVSQVAAPLLTMVSPAAPVAGSASVALSVSTPSTGPFVYAWAQLSGPAVTLSGAAGSAVSFTAPPSKGLDMVFQAKVTNSYGAVTTSRATVRVNNAPVMASQADGTATVAVQYQKTVAASDRDGDALTFVLTEFPAGAQIQGGTITWNTPTAGTARFTVVASDGTASSQPVSFNVVVAAAVVVAPVPNRAPVMTPHVDVNVSAGTGYTTTVGATDPDGNALTVRMTASPVGATLVGSTVTWAFPYAGSGHFTFVANDGQLDSAPMSFNVVIAAAGGTPVVSTHGNDEASIGSQYRTNVAGTDSNNDAMTFTLIEGPQGATLVGNVLTWQANAAGTVKFTILASDGKSNSQPAAFFVTVAAGAVNQSAFSCTAVAGPNSHDCHGPTGQSFSCVASGGSYVCRDAVAQYTCTPGGATFSCATSTGTTHTCTTSTGGFDCTPFLPASVPVTPAPATPAPSGGASSGGGGAVSLLELMAMLLLVTAVSRSRKR